MAKIFTTANPTATNFSYHPPTQPSTTKKKEEKENSLALIHVASVTAFKFNNDEKKYDQIPGKVNAAILGNILETTFEILLYKSKNEQIGTFEISVDFNFTIQKQSYFSFSDKQKKEIGH